MTERRIKELAIALEALSRINGADAYFQQVCTLLQTAIDDKHRENNPPHNPLHNSLALTTDDDIPF